MWCEKRFVRLYFLKNQAVIADKCHVAECFFDRLRGLIGRRELEPGRGMFFPNCNSIHMYFMKFAIDVIFAKAMKGQNGTTVWTVTSAHSNIRPWRPHPLIDWSASDTIELPIGTIAKFSIKPGDEICLN